jgi:F-type H+-transporting ATPase subunit gamma
MANTQDIRRRIKSIRNTAQITKAMQMVACLKDAQGAAARARRTSVCWLVEQGLGLTQEPD